MDDVTEAVFVDPSGRRRRLLRNIGILTGCLLVAYLMVAAVGLLTGSAAPFAPWPGATQGPGLSARTAPPAVHHRARHASPTPTRVSPSPTASPSATPTPTARATTRGATARPTVALGRGNGHGRGLTKRPNPRKPAG